MIIDLFVPNKLRDDSKEYSRAKIMIYILLLMAGFSLTSYTINFIIQTNSLFPFLPVAFLSIVLLLLLKITNSIQLTGHATVGALAYAFCSLTLNTGGICSIDFVSIFLVTMVAYITVGFRAGLPWILFCMIWGGYLYGLAGDASQMQYFRNQTLDYDRNYYLAITVVNLLFPFGVFSAFHFENKKLFKKLENKRLSLEQINKEYEVQAIELKNTQEKLELSNQELESYAYATSHDLKQPVNTVKNFTKLLNRHLTKNEQLDDTSSEYLSLISASSNNMSKLIDDLLVYSRLTSSNENHFEKLDLDNILDNVLMDLKHQIDTNHVIVERADLPTINVVPIKINQIFQNIISNAIKFKKQDEALTIKISSVKKDKCWQLSIEDNGIGINEKFHEKIFNPFQKIHNQADYPGSGIGLATCKRIAKLHKGDIWVESKIGVGTKFHFTLSTEEALSSVKTEIQQSGQRQFQ